MTRRHHWLRVVAAVSLLAAALGTFGAVNPGTALGPIIAITPNELGGSAGLVYNPTLSGRGESAAMFDWEMFTNGWALFDAPGQEQMIDDGDGMGAAVSGDGCVLVRALREFPVIGILAAAAQAPDVVFRYTNRCNGVTDVEIYRTSGNYFELNPIAVSFTGRYVAVVVPTGVEAPYAVLRIDTSNGAIAQMPLPEDYFDFEPERGIAISGDGSVLAAVAWSQDFAGSTFATILDVLTWQVGTAQPQIVSGVFGGPASAWPSLSGDGRFVSFASAEQLAGPEPGGGPWVFVLDRATGQISRVSRADAAGYYSSISRDGTQVAYVGSNPCEYDTSGFDDIEFSCPASRIEVAFGPAPRVAGPGSPETVVAVTPPTNGGGVWQPVLSGNGRWVAWLSDAGAELMGNPNMFGQNAFMRRRDPALTISTVDFGTLAANTQSAPATATVTNTGRTSISLDSITATPGQFTIVGGGTCVGGSLLAPGASCTVNVRYNAPNNTSQTTGSLTISEAGYDPISATGRLIGRSSVIPPPTTTTTTTTPPGPTTTRPRPTTTTTTTPGQVILTADPSPVDYGQVAVGLASEVKTLTVTNIGTGTGQLLTVMEGDHPDDFYVLRNGCNEVVLAPNESCTMDIMMIPLAGGRRQAILTISVGGVSGGIDLFGIGHFAPQLIATPAAITTRGITTIVGRGFPPNETFTVRVGNTDLTLTGTSDETGVFRIPFSAFNTLELGHYLLEVDAVPDVFELVRGQLVVVLPTFEPQGPGGPVFGEALIVTRG